MVVVSTFAQGCIVADAPQYTTPGQRAPVLDLYDAAPLILKIIEVQDKDPVILNVPVRSEDAGEQLFAILLVDYDTPTRGFAGEQLLAASTYDDATRVIAITWAVNVANVGAGCHRLTLIVTHPSSFDFGKLQVRPTRTTDAALATWLLNVAPQPGVPVDLSSCPVPS